MKKIEFKIDQIQSIGGNVIYLKLVPKILGQKVKYRAGQYGLVSFFSGESLSKERPFSFMSSPLDEGVLEFGFKVFGQFTTEFSQLQKGDSVFVRGPFGAYIFDETKYQDTVFLSAGIGITPFMSIFRYATAKNLPNKLTLLYSNKTSRDTPFYNEIKALESANSNLKTAFFVTGKDEVPPQGFISGRVSQEEILKVINGDIKGKTFFICGPQQFYDSMVAVLQKMGVKTKNIKSEGFTLSPTSFFERGTWAFPMVAGASAMVMIASLYGVYQLEASKLLASAITTQEKLDQMTDLNQQISDNKNALLEDQKANTQTIYTTVPQSTSPTSNSASTTTQVNTTTTVTPPPTTTVTPPTTTTPPPPRTTVS